MPRLTLNGKIIDLKKIVFITIILVLIATNIIFLIKYFSLGKELKETKEFVKSQQINEKLLGFAKLFIEKVLKAETEVSFEDRLKLENAVRNLGDEEILTQWQKFTESKTEVQAQEEVKNLLEMLVDKIKVQ